MKANKISKSYLWSNDIQGNMKFTTRTGRIESALDNETFWERTAISVAFMIGGLILDFVDVKHLMGTIMHSRVWLQYFFTFGFLIPFDGAAVWLGVLIKKRAQGLKPHKILEGLLIFAIIGAFLLNLWLRIVKRDDLVPTVLSMAGALFSVASDGPVSDPVAFPFAITTAFLPLGTSLVSIVASYMCSNPLKTRIKKFRKQKVELEDQINEIKCSIEELNADKELEKRLDEEDLYYLKEKILYAEHLSFYYADYVRQRLKEYIGEPASTNELSKNIHEYIIQQQFPKGVTEALEQNEYNTIKEEELCLRN